MNPNRVIFDTNVISALAREPRENTRRKVLSPSDRIFVPYFIVQELLAGKPSGEIEFLNANSVEIEDGLDTTQIDAISRIERLQVHICQMLVFGKTEGLTYEENLRLKGFGPLQLNNLHPPRVVQRIVERLESQPDGESASYYFKSKDTDLGLSDQIALQALLLALLGFWRDRLMLKSIPDLNWKGMHKQYQDAKLIGVASDFESIFSADLRLCLIAYAVFEYNSIPTRVLFVDRNNELDVVEVSAGTWPSLTTRQA